MLNNEDKLISKSAKHSYGKAIKALLEVYNHISDYVRCQFHYYRRITIFTTPYNMTRTQYLISILNINWKKY